MRFKTRVRVEKIPDLLRLAQTLEKLEKLCVLHLQALDQDTVRFVVTPTVEGSVAAYAQISTVSLASFVLLYFPLALSNVCSSLVPFRRPSGLKATASSRKTATKLA